MEGGSLGSTLESEDEETWEDADESLSLFFLFDEESEFEPSDGGPPSPGVVAIVDWRMLGVAGSSTCCGTLLA